MNKLQFGIINIVGGLCAALIFFNVVLARLNGRLNQAVTQTQSQLDTAQQLHAALQNLAVRIAQTAQTNLVLRDLLRRQELQVTLNVNGQLKQVP